MKRVFHYTLLLLCFASLCYFIYVAAVSVYPEPFIIASLMSVHSALAMAVVIQEFKL